MPVFLDTSAYIEIERGNENLVRYLTPIEEILLSTVVVGELLAGFGSDPRFMPHRARFRAFQASPRVRVTPVSLATAELYSVIYGQLRRKGRPIPQNDIWIAAGALEHNATLVSFDEHFSQIEELRWVRPA